MPVRMRIRLAIALAVLAGLSAACGGSLELSAGRSGPQAGKSALTLLHEARKAARAARSVRLVGAGGADLSALDLHLAAGRGGRGTATVSGLTFSVVRSGGSIYLRGDAGFTRRFAGSAASLVGRRWFRVPARRAGFRSFAGLTNMRVVLASLLSPTGHSITTLAPSTVNGVRVIGLLDRGHGTLYVAAHGTPFPIEIRSTSGDRLDFEGWNRPVTLAPPPGAVSLARLLKTI